MQELQVQTKTVVPATAAVKIEDAGKTADAPETTVDVGVHVLADAGAANATAVVATPERRLAIAPAVAAVAAAATTPRPRSNDTSTEQETRVGRRYPAEASADIQRIWSAKRTKEREEKNNVFTA